MDRAVSLQRGSSLMRGELIAVLVSETLFSQEVIMRESQEET